ncbi:MAG: CAP domain-containing protein [Actinomycetota bacterium]
MKRTKLLASAFALTLTAALFAPPPAIAEDSDCWDYKDGDRRLARSINRLRVRNGLRAVSLDPELSRVARKHTKEMIAARMRSHTPARVLGRRVTRWEVLGENVGTAPTLKSLIREMRSPGEQRDNLLFRRFRHLGLAIKWAHKQVWGTVVLEARLDPGTRLDMPDC